MSDASQDRVQEHGHDPDQGPVGLLEAELPVVEVTLLEDRAVVVRRGVVEVPHGRSRLVVDGVAPVLVDKTLAAALTPVDAAGGEGLRVRSVRVTRRRVTSDGEQTPDFAELRVRLRHEEAEIHRLNQASVRISQELASLATLIDLTVAEINEDVGWARSDRSRWAEQLDALELRQLELAREREQIHHEQRRRAQDVEDLGRRVTAGSNLATEARATLELELLNLGTATRRVELRVDYLCPGALWRPWHSARLIEAGDSPARVEFCCAGAVWQNTGEDWSDVQLIFSTERPSLGVTPPTLTTDRLLVRKKGPAVEVEARDQTVHTAGLGADPVATKIAEELPGIDDGGEALDLRARTKASVPSDGRPHRVPIFEFDAPAETAWICVPERVLAVMLRSRQANGSEHPLLAGPVDLIRHSGLVGRTSILFIGPGERFEIGWGPDPALRVSREVETLEHERKLMSSWVRKPRTVEVKLSNLGPTPVRVEVQERIAVSELDKVEVELVEASHGARPDADGFVSWSVALRGFAQDELALTWTLVVHDDVVGL